MKLSVIVPVYNEEKILEQALIKITSTNFPIETEFVIVDNGSRDNSYKIMQEFKKNSKKDIVLLQEKNNIGKGSAIVKGIKKTTGDVLVINDADLEYEPEELNVLLKELLKLDSSHAVFGSRLLKKQKNWKKNPNYFGNKFLSFFISLLYFKKITDLETCYKMFYKESLKGINLVSKGFEIEPEITSKFLRKGIKIKEIPITYTPRTVEEGKKINYKDGIKALFAIIKFRFIKL